MKPKVRLPYGARSEAEMQRNLARLGTRWQANPTPEPVLQRSAASYWWEGFFWGWFWGSWWR
jgi:hypothetical protein